MDLELWQLGVLLVLFWVKGLVHGYILFRSKKSGWVSSLNMSVSDEKLVEAFRKQVQRL